MSRRPPVAIVGAGFSGLAMAIALRRAGRDDFVVFEASDRVGGTWRENTYPGCGCDIPSHLYSYSFETNPRWTRTYPPQAEILEYLERCVAKYGLTDHIRFNARVRRAAYDQSGDTWTLETDAGATTRARVVVSAPGPLAVPVVPPIPGLDTFAGPVFHSGAWDHQTDLDGKRVAVVGTGASAIQVVPAIAGRVGRLSVFQRTAPWVMRKPDVEIPPAVREALARFPVLHRLGRSLIYGIAETVGASFFLEPRLMAIRERVAKRRLAREISDPDLRERLTPDYRMGCKRVLFSNDYYKTLAYEHVDLVTASIERIEPDAICTDDGRRHPADVIALCTGFDPLGGALGYEVVGRAGTTLHDAWKQHPEAYFGIAIHGFPNFFGLLGPNTGLGHNSVLIMVEAQVHFIMQCIELLASGRRDRVEVRLAAQRAYDAAVQSRMRNAVWSTGCSSWYLDERGRNVALWPGSTIEYWLRTRRVDLRAIEDHVSRAAPPAPST